MILNAIRMKQIAREGLYGRGRIVSVSPTGTSVNDAPVMKLDVLVTIDDAPPIRASAKRRMHGAEQLVVPRCPSSGIRSIRTTSCSKSERRQNPPSLDRSLDDLERELRRRSKEAAVAGGWRTEPASAMRRPLMTALSGRQKKHLRALAHHLEPLVQVGKEGVSEAVVQATRQALLDHELIKVRFPQVDREEREAMIETLERESGAALAGVMGRIAILYRRHPNKPKIQLPR